MPDRPEFALLADFLQEPLLLLGIDGCVEFANRSALELFGSRVVGCDLTERVVGRDDFLRYLVRCSGTSRPMIGSAIFRTSEGAERKLQLHAALFRQAGDASAARVIVRCRTRGAEEFSVLGRKIDELNREVRQRRRTQAALEESLAQKDTLLRELQHRTKNHTQMLIGMFSSAAKETQSPEARAVLDAALARLRSIGAAQQLMYEVERLDSVPARQLVEGVCEAIAETWPPAIELDVDSEDAALPNDVAVPLALILNELLSNALKHGLKYSEGRVAVDLHREGTDLVLSVWDSGAGPVGAIPARRASGLSIVRGLCRQVGGVFDMNPGDGMRVTMRFPNPEARPRSVAH